MRNYHQTSRAASWMPIRFVSAPRDDSKCSESAPWFIMHECTACNQTKLCCSLARENEIMMMFSKNECFMGFQFGASESGQLTPMRLFSDWAVRWPSCYAHSSRDIYDSPREEEGEPGGEIVPCLHVVLAFGSCACFPSTKSPQAAFSASETLKLLLVTQKTNRSLSNVISFFSLMWTASLKY